MTRRDELNDELAELAVNDAAIESALCDPTPDDQSFSARVRRAAAEHVRDLMRRAES